MLYSTRILSTGTTRSGTVHLRRTTPRLARIAMMLVALLFGLRGVEAQTVLTNGVETAGSIVSNSTNTYTFTATNGNAILLRAGAPALNPRIVLFNPLGQVFASAGSGASGVRDVNVAVQATNAGTFTVQVSSIFGGSGTYTLCLAQIPAPFVVLPGDSGGTLTNGWEFAGTNVLGDMDMWTFSANTGDNIVLRMGSPSFNPWIRLYGPDGTLVGSAANGAAGVLNIELTAQATNSGTFTVVSSSFTTDGSGNYILNMAQAPAPVFVAPGDEGGPMTNGWEHTGTIDLGDLDVWTFSANSGDSIILRMGSSAFNPYIRLYGPDGKLVGSAGNGAAGALNAELSLQATNSGAFTVVATSFSGNNTGSYILNLAKSPGTVFVSPGDDGGPMTNGWKHTGTIDLGDLDVWTFNATAGDNIVLRMGATNYNPLIRLFGPTGKEVGVAGSGIAGTLMADLAIQATNSGAFTVVASSFGGNNTGPYILNLAQSPGQVFVSPGDEGGPLTNGWKEIGTLDLGDLDVWTFDANGGDTLLLRMASTNYNPWMRLYGPAGQLVASAGTGVAGNLDVSLSLQATNTGPYTLVVSTFGSTATGPYLLNMVDIPGTFFEAPGDQGGTLVDAVNQSGTIDTGDMDVWTFSACKGYPVALDCQRLSVTGPGFTPRIRLYGHSGALLASAQSTTNTLLFYTVTNSGAFTAVIDGAGANDSGTYQLTGFGIYANGLALCPPIIAAPNTELTGYGGDSNVTFVILTSTNITTSLSSWTPFLTNQFDPSGSLDITKANSFSNEPQRYFRLQIPQ